MAARQVLDDALDDSSVSWNDVLDDFEHGVVQLLVHVVHVLLHDTTNVTDFIVTAVDAFHVFFGLLDEVGELHFTLLGTGDEVASGGLQSIGCDSESVHQSVGLFGTGDYKRETLLPAAREVRTYRERRREGRSQELLISF